MQEMFLRSEEKYSVKYTHYIGDGDTKTFQALLKCNPYQDVVVKKKGMHWSCAKKDGN